MATVSPPRTGACPRCGLVDPGPVACARCGVIFAKLRTRPAPEAPPPPAEHQDEASARFSWSTVLVVLVLAACAWAGWRNLRTSAPPTRAAVARASPALPAPRLAAEPPPPPPMPAAEAPPAEQVRVSAAAMPDEDRREAEALVHRLAAATPADVTTAEQLFSRHPEARPLLEATLLSAAEGERRRRRYTEAASLLQRATVVQTEAARPCVRLMDTLLEAGDWTAAEAAARSALEREPRNADAWYGLGYALLRQDRNPDAVEALRTSVEIRPDPGAQALLDRVAKGMTDERGMTERDLSHFHVRYDGETHEDVGREILRALERHYATLVPALDHQPQGTIPVILFSSEAYYSAAGAPAWSGGVYDSLDGRIRVPIRGLTRSLTPDMDSTLLHELTHAFVADRTRGVAPRDIQEG